MSPAPKTNTVRGASSGAGSSGTAKLSTKAANGGKAAKRVGRALIPLMGARTGLGLTTRLPPDPRDALAPLRADDDDALRFLDPVDVAVSSPSSSESSSSSLRSLTTLLARRRRPLAVVACFCEGVPGFLGAVTGGGTIDGREERRRGPVAALVVEVTEPERAPALQR